MLSKGGQQYFEIFLVTLNIKLSRNYTKIFIFDHTNNNLKYNWIEMNKSIFIILDQDNIYALMREGLRDTYILIKFTWEDKNYI